MMGFEDCDAQYKKYQNLIQARKDFIDFSKILFS